MKKVAVVILNFKVKEQTLKCVDSVKKSSYNNIAIIVVDNHSQDGLVKEIRKQEDVVFIQNDDNLGYTGGNNAGIKYALSNGADYVFILNADAIVDKNTIQNLVITAEKENAGICGPKVLFGDKKTIWYAGGTMDLANVLGGHRGLDENDIGQYDKIVETGYVTGGMMMIKREVFESIGLFDDQYFLYYEDSDFSFRAKRAGFKIIYVPTSTVYHENAQSTGLGSPLQDYFITRNRMLFASKFLSWRTRFALLREALRNIFNPVRRLALFDFLTGHLGKGSYFKCYQS